MSNAIFVLWHAPSNYMATCEIRKGGALPLLLILDDEFTGINPFYTYPLSFLSGYGWEVIGEL